MGSNSVLRTFIIRFMLFGFSLIGLVKFLDSATNNSSSNLMEAANAAMPTSAKIQTLKFARDNPQIMQAINPNLDKKSIEEGLDKMIVEYENQSNGQSNTSNNK